MKMRKVAFQYPGSPAPQLNDITLQVSLSSRVAVLGPNGSGKSTLVKLLVGETEPNLGGEVWKHPNLVIGYVAQHAFHHVRRAVLGGADVSRRSTTISTRPRSSIFCSATRPVRTLRSSPRPTVSSPRRSSRR